MNSALDAAGVAIVQRRPAAVTPPDALRSLSSWVGWHAAARPEAQAVAAVGSTLSYRELADRARILGAHLRASGVRPGDRALLAVPNSPATVVAAVALDLIGATSVEVDRNWSPELLRTVVTHSGARGLIAGRADERRWAAALEGVDLDAVDLAGIWWVHPDATSRDGAAVRVGAELGHIGGDGTLLTASRPGIDVGHTERAADDVAVILYTSGSTGRPHGVIQTVRNIHANTRSIAQYLGLSHADRALLVLPLHYCYGRSVLQTHLWAGGSVVLETRTAFPRVVMETIAAERCTGFAGVPQSFEMIRRNVDLSTIDLSSLRYMTQAGGAMAPDTTSWVRRSIHPAELYVMYGQTEATARLAYLPPSQGEAKAGSIGIPIPGVELRVVDPAGRELPVGVVGELVARGENVTPGYLDDPEANAVILRDGWLWTGDLALRDADGYLFLQGRAKDILKIGGRRVSPVEIEHVIAQHPAVLEAAVRGRPDPMKGEVPVAMVVLRPDARLESPELRRFCLERLAAYLVPVEFHQVARLPRNAAGKLLRAELTIPTMQAS
ncbi:MAG: class I adenylate-forming enzyme family protein [Chloroflexota bacterium]